PELRRELGPDGALAGAAQPDERDGGRGAAGEACFETAAHFGQLDGAAAIVELVDGGAHLGALVVASDDGARVEQRGGRGGKGAGDGVEALEGDVAVAGFELR